MIRFSVAAAAVILLAGCEKTPFEVAPVRGTVTIDGQPLTIGRVMFAPAATSDGLNAGKPALGTIRTGGGYVLSTYGEDDGAVVGEHTVTILGPPKRLPGATPVSTRVNGLTFSRLTVPRRFSVAAGQENQIDIKLTSEDVARYGVKDD